MKEWSVLQVCGTGSLLELLRSKRLLLVKDLVHLPPWELRDWLLITEEGEQNKEVGNNRLVLVLLCTITIICFLSWMFTYKSYKFTIIHVFIIFFWKDGKSYVVQRLWMCCKWKWRCSVFVILRTNPTLVERIKAFESLSAWVFSMFSKHNQIMHMLVPFGKQDFP